MAFFHLVLIICLVSTPLSLTSYHPHFCLCVAECLWVPMGASMGHGVDMGKSVNLGHNTTIGLIFGALDFFFLFGVFVSFGF